MHEPSVTIIIPLYVISDRFFLDFKKYQQLDYKNFDIIVVCDREIEIPQLEGIKTQLMLTDQKHTGPAEKRDLALKYAKGELCAFIDDDAYPDKQWLKKACRWFRNQDFVAVGGPGLTPPDDSMSQKIGGYILESYLCSGEIQNRFYSDNIPSQKMVVDWPAYNLIVRTNILKKIGGYGSTFYGGEDTLLCMKLLKHGKILCDSEVIVYHHRRSFPLGHLKQISGIGIHRGYFFRVFPETSRTIIYLLPTILTLSFIAGIFLSILKPIVIGLPFLFIFSFVWLLAFWSIRRHGRDTLSSIYSAFGIILTHMTYGFSFVRGFLTPKLSR